MGGGLVEGCVHILAPPPPDPNPDDETHQLTELPHGLHVSLELKQSPLIASHKQASAMSERLNPRSIGARPEQKASSKQSVIGQSTEVAFKVPHACGACVGHVATSVIIWAWIAANA